METAASSYPNLHGPTPKESRPHSTSYINDQGRLVRQDVAPMIMDDLGRCRCWHIKSKRWVFHWAPDVSEGVAAGELSYTEQAGTPQQAAVEHLAHEKEAGEFEGLSLAELRIRAEAIGLKYDPRWKEKRLRNELRAEMIKRADAPSIDDLTQG